MANKNDDERYYERLEENKEKADEYFSRAFDIISSEIPMEKLGGPTFYKCKWCNFYHICHYGESVLKNCRTCEAADVCDEGQWQCSRHGGMILATEQQRIGCGNYKLLKSLK